MQKLELCSTATVNKAETGEKKPSMETQKEIINCLHQATVQAGDRIWKRCGIIPLFYVVLFSAAGSGNVLICPEFTLTVRIAVHLL